VDSPLVLLFLSAFLAATILPVSSEVVLMTVAADSVHPVWLLVAVATLGNTLGSVVNWLLGRFFAHFSDRRWFPLSPEGHSRASRWFQKYGIWSLLFAWLPIVGDPVAVVAGVFRVSLAVFIPLVAIGKAARYLFLAGVVESLWG